MPDDVLGVTSGESAGGDAAVDSASGAAIESSGGGASADDYSDLAGDPRVQKYVSDLHSKALKDIPKEYRDGGKFKELLSARQRLQELESNPGFRAFLAGQAAAQGQAPGNAQQQQKAASLLEAITGKLGKRYGLDDNRATFLGEYGDLISEHLLQAVESKYFKPIQEHLVNQRIESEWAEAQKLPGFQEAFPAIQKVMERYNNSISYQDAYKIAKFDDDLQKAQAEAAKAAAAGAGEEESDAKLRRAKESSEKPTGRGTGDVSLKKARNRESSIENAKRRLAAQGVNLTE